MYSSMLCSTTRAAQRSWPAHNKLYCRWINYLTSWIRAKRVVSGRVRRVRLQVDKTAKQRVPSICNILQIARIRHIYFITCRAAMLVSNYCRQGQRSVLWTASHVERRRTAAALDCHSRVLSAAGKPLEEQPWHYVTWTDCHVMASAAVFSSATVTLLPCLPVLSWDVVLQALVIPER